MEDQATELISKFITEVGLPVSLLLGSVGCIYFLIRYVLGQIVTTIEKNQAEAREDALGCLKPRRARRPALSAMLWRAEQAEKKMALF